MIKIRKDFFGFDVVFEHSSMDELVSHVIQLDLAMSIEERLHNIFVRVKNLDHLDLFSERGIATKELSEGQK